MTDHHYARGVGWMAGPRLGGPMPVVLTTDEGDHKTADEGVPVPPGDRLDAGRTSAGTPNSPSAEGSAGVAATASAGPYTHDEFRALIQTVWDFTHGIEPGDDLTRFDELLYAALVFLGQIALRPTAWPASPRLAAELLRSMEQRALWGPDHPVRQP